MIRRLSDLFREGSGPKSSPTKIRKPATAGSVQPAAFRQRLAVPGGAATSPPVPIGEDLSVFHDCWMGEVLYRQSPADEQGNHALSLEGFRFAGSYLSLVWDLPDDFAQKADAGHVVSFGADVSSEREQEVYLRLNVEHGPNHGQVLRHISANGGPKTVEFDLAYAELSERPVSRMWLDVLLDAPEMNRFDIRDLWARIWKRAQI